jgi:hypothetical protein
MELPVETDPVVAFLLSGSQSEFMGILDSWFMYTWPTCSSIYVAMAARLFPDLEHHERCELTPGSVTTTGEDFQEEYARLMKSLTLVRMPQWWCTVSVSAPPPSDRVHPAIEQDGTERHCVEIKIRQRFVWLLRRLLMQGPSTFAALMLIVEQGYRWPDEYDMNAVNSLAAICNYVRAGETIPVPVEVLTTLLTKVLRVASLAYNAANCIDALAQIGTE